MELSGYSQDGSSVNLHFVRNDNDEEEDCTDCLVCAYQACKDHELNPIWITTKEVLNHSPSKQDIFVCDPFEGKAFMHLTENGSFKCVRVLGPRCILSCLLRRKEPVPELPSPIHNTAMKELIITLTGFDAAKKKELQSLIGQMAGMNSNNFSVAVTHVIADTVGSKKYQVAAEREIPVMTGEWVHAVWEAVLKDYEQDVVATDEQFLTYTCPIFKGLVICVSQMPKKEKEALKKLIESNGGTYAASLAMTETSVLITPVAQGDKYQHALQWRIHCLLPDWIYESVEQNYAIGMDRFRVEMIRASTPTKDTENALDLPNISTCSTILMSESNMNITNQVNETVDNNSTLCQSRLLCNVDPKVSSSLEAVESLDLLAAMKAGLFLDGCKIFLSGFNNTQAEKLRRCLNAGGATRFNQLTDSVTHVVIGKVVEEHLSSVESWQSKPHIVTADWIVESVKLRRTAEEGDFLYRPTNTDQKPPDNILHNMSPPKLKPAKALQVSQNDQTYIDDDLMNQYMKGGDHTNTTLNTSARRRDSLNESALPNSQASTVQGMYKGKSFTISGYTEDIIEQLGQAIEMNGGHVVSLNHRGKVDYCIVTLEGEGDFHPMAKHYISHQYIEDCIEQEMLVPIEYFHLPIIVSKLEDVLSDCVIAISTYVGKERIFLEGLARSQGAIFQELFAKKHNPSKNVKKSTHLICPASEGDKYRAAIKWGVPPVTRDWLIQCAINGSKLEEEKYRVDALDSSKSTLDALSAFSDLIMEKIRECAVDDKNDSTILAATPISSKVRILKSQDIDFKSPAAIHTPDLETMRRLYPTPGREKPNDSLSQMPTPETPYGCTWYPNPDAKTRKAYKRLIDSLPDNPEPKRAKKDISGTPVEVYMKRIGDNIQEFLHKNPMPSLDDDTFSAINGQNNNKEPDNIDLEPLKNVVVCVSKKLHKIQQDICDVVTSLGGEHRWVYDDSVTHFVFQGRNNDTSKDFRLARDQDKIIVAPEWVWMCRDEKTRFDESLFPHSYNPKLSLSISSTKSLSKPRKQRTSKKDDTVTSITEEVESGTSNSDDSQLETNSSKGEEQPKEETISKHLEELQALASVSVDKESLSRRSSASNSKNKSLSDHVIPTPPRVLGPPPASMDIASSQTTAVTWVDPEEKEARQQLKKQLLSTSRDTQDIITDNNIMASLQFSEPIVEESESQEMSTWRPEKSHVFIISGLGKEDKLNCGIVIEQLGGEVRDCMYFDSEATHILTPKPSRSEKHLAAIASGKWLLHPSFVSASAEAGVFLREEEYEWGNPAAAKNLPILDEDSIEMKVVKAAHRWRLKLSSDTESTGAFYGMKVIIHTSSDKQAPFSRLIIAGGGEVDTTSKAPYTDPDSDITHCLIDANKPFKVDLAVFASRKIPCVNTVYLSDFLMSEETPDVSDFYIPQYQEIIANMT